MTADRETTVLFADVAGSSRLYELAGNNTAADAVRRCLEVMHGATKDAGGRVVKTMGDGLMAVFAHPDRATQAATRMHLAVSALPAIEGEQLALRIGFHAGTVIQRDDDIFGDTVNIAARLAAQATRGQVLTSAETVAKLTPLLRSATRHLYDVNLKGKTDDVALCEVLWSKSPDITDVPLGQAPRTSNVRLRLVLGGQEIVRRRGTESVSIGRDLESTLVVSDSAASRHHCVIERRQDHFVIRDQSSNGTYVLVEGDSEDTVLRREEFVLRGHGWISCGRPKAEASESAEYFCEEEVD